MYLTKVSVWTMLYYAWRSLFIKLGVRSDKPTKVGPGLVLSNKNQGSGEGSMLSRGAQVLCSLSVISSTTPLIFDILLEGFKDSS